MEKRIGTAIILIKSREAVPLLNQIISSHSEIIIGRQGLPVSGKAYSLISLVLEGTTDEIGSLTGQIGRLKGIQTKSIVLKIQEENEKN